MPVHRYLGLLLGPGLGTFAFNAVTVTMPQISADLGASAASAGLIVAGYGIPFAALLILGGRLGDRFGRHRLFVIGMSLFLVSALACGFAPSLALLIAARITQGLGAALCTPQVLATIQATSTGTARVRAISAFGAFTGIGAAVGQVVGGAVAELGLGVFNGWRWTFWLLALGAAASIALAGRAPRSRSHEAVDLDAAGVVELGVGLVLIAGALTFGPSLGWSVPVFAALVAGIAALLVLWWHQNRIEASGRVPLLPPSILRLRPLQLGLVMAFLFFAGYAGVLFVIPRGLEAGLGLSSLGAGLVLGPFAVVFAVVSLCVGRIQARLGDRTLVLGVSVQLVALGSIAVLALVWWGPALPWILQPSLLVLGAGQALVFSPLTQLVVREVPVAAAGLSGGLFSTVQQLALSMGVIIVGAMSVATGVSPSHEFALGFVFDVALVAVVLALTAVLGRLVRRGGPLIR